MSNPAYGYTDVTEHWAVRISDNGEFIHQNQDTVGDQGVDNVSHGCINLSADERRRPTSRSAIYGDPVEVTGTSVQLSARRRRHLRLGLPGTNGWRSRSRHDQPPSVSKMNRWSADPLGPAPFLRDVSAE